jgi:hypothetical protein
MTTKNNETTMTNVLEKIEKARQSPTSEYAKAVAKWADHDFIIQAGDGPWLMEGFLKFFMALRDIAAAVEPTVPEGLPPHILDAKTVARFFGLPLEQFNVVQFGYDRLENAVAKLEGLETAQNPPNGVLNDKEHNILEALGDEKMTGEELGKRAGYPYNAAFKSSLSSLVRRGLLENKRPGYVLSKQGEDIVRTDKN